MSRVKLFFVVYLILAFDVVGWCQSTGKKRELIDIFNQDESNPTYLIWKDKFIERELVSIHTNLDSIINDSLIYFIRLEYNNDSISSKVFKNLLENSFDSCHKQVSFHLITSYNNFFLVRNQNFIELWLYNVFREEGGRERFLVTTLLNSPNLILHKISCKGIVYEINGKTIHKYCLGLECPDTNIFETYFNESFSHTLSIDDIVKLTNTN